MPRLKISGFSCIAEADIELSQFTILIGPQGSGKSVISKLIYFMTQILSRPINAAQEAGSLDSFKDEIEADFKRYFPPSAWGSSGFSIEFESGSVNIKIYRNKPRKEHSEGRLRIKFSENFVDLYREFESAIHSTMAAKGLDDPQSLGLSESFAALRPARNIFTKSLYGDLKVENAGLLLFIPAGRSFFTSMGKTAMAFEYAGVLDPLTIRFGRQFTNIRDHRRAFGRPQNEDKALRSARDRIALDLFGGTIRMQRDQDVIVCKDGRVVPFSAMSSGQQELLPLWQAVDYYAYLNDFPSATIFIEEPEAHLFPSAQCQLIEYLSAFIRVPDRYKMIVTTHSPYVLTKINNLLKAGKLGQHKSLSQDVEKVVPKYCWLRPESFQAYCINDGRVSSIFDGNIVDAEYLDEVSSDISTEFSRLLDIEFDDV